MAIDQTAQISTDENLWQILKTRIEKQVNEMLVKKQTVTVEVSRGVIQKDRPKHIC